MGFDQLIHEVSMHPQAQEMKDYIQHGKISTYDHCMDVAKWSYRLNKTFHVGSDEKQLVRGAFLHDFYLYDWHDHQGRWHGYKHPHIAKENASRFFSLTKKEKNIIQSHMWPLTLFHFPKSREAVLVCVADKICSTNETLFKR